MCAPLSIPAKPFCALKVRAGLDSPAFEEMVEWDLSGLLLMCEQRLRNRSAGAIRNGAAWAGIADFCAGFGSRRIYIDRNGKVERK
jgi:hypothetical protein